MVILVEGGLWRQANDQSFGEARRLKELLIRTLILHVSRRRNGRQKNGRLSGLKKSPLSNLVLCT
jgi:hypothetical protein